MRPCNATAQLMIAALFIFFLVFSTAAFAPSQAPHESPASIILRSATTVFIQAKSDYFSPSALERELLKQREFQVWGMTITRDKEDADLFLEVTRKKWTTRFTITIVDPRTGHIIASCEDTSLGGTIEPKLAKCFVNQVKAVRPLPPAK